MNYAKNNKKTYFSLLVHFEILFFTNIDEVELNGSDPILNFLSNTVILNERLPVTK